MKNKDVYGVMLAINGGKPMRFWPTSVLLFVWFCGVVLGALLVVMMLREGWVVLA